MVWNRRIITAAAGLALAGASPLAAETTTMTEGVKIEKVDDGRQFPEGPVWHPDGYLLYSDVYGATIQKIVPGGPSEPWLDAGLKTNGMIMSPDGARILACCHGDLTFLAIDARTREVTVLAAERPGGGKFNNVNDAAVGADGVIYFSDPKWGAKPGDPQGVYMIKPDGTVALAAPVENQPNGLVVSPDQKWLYVARSGGHDIWRFPRNSDGTLGEGARWVDLGAPSEPDGMTFDSRGNLFVCQAGDGHVRVLSPEGDTLARIPVFTRMCTNCEFEGGSDTVLYVTGGGAQNKTNGAVYKLTFDKPF